MLLIYPPWIDTTALKSFNLVSIPADEPWGANVLPIGGYVCLAAEHVRTAELLHRMGLRARACDVSEIAKAEAGVTCLSVLID